jgi:hypothetical protein
MRAYSPARNGAAQEHLVPTGAVPGGATCGEDGLTGLGEGHGNKNRPEERGNALVRSDLPSIRACSGDFALNHNWKENR